LQSASQPASHLLLLLLLLLQVGLCNKYIGQAIGVCVCIFVF
jgi:hypothetical protein